MLLFRTIASTDLFPIHHSQMLIEMAKTISCCIGGCIRSGRASSSSSCRAQERLHSQRRSDLFNCDSRSEQTFRFCVQFTRRRYQLEQYRGRRRWRIPFVAPTSKCKQATPVRTPNMLYNISRVQASHIRLRDDQDTLVVPRESALCAPCRLVPFSWNFVGLVPVNIMTRRPPSFLSLGIQG